MKQHKQKRSLSQKQDQWAETAWHGSCLSGFTSEISQTLIPLLIASNLKRVRVKNTERNHMVTSEKPLQKKARQLRWGEAFPKIRRQEQKSLSFTEYSQRLLSPRVEAEEEMDYNKQLPFTFFGMKGWDFPVLQHIIESSSFPRLLSYNWKQQCLDYSLLWFPWPRRKLGTPSSCSPSSSKITKREAKETSNKELH